MSKVRIAVQLIVRYLKYIIMTTAMIRTFRHSEYCVVNSELPEVQHYGHGQDEGCQR